MTTPIERAEQAIACIRDLMCWAPDDLLGTEATPDEWIAAQALLHAVKEDGLCEGVMDASERSPGLKLLTAVVAGIQGKSVDASLDNLADDVGEVPPWDEIAKALAIYYEGVASSKSHGTPFAELHLIVEPGDGKKYSFTTPGMKPSQPDGAGGESNG